MTPLAWNNTDFYFVFGPGTLISRAAGAPPLPAAGAKFFGPRPFFNNFSVFSIADGDGAPPLPAAGAKFFGPRPVFNDFSVFSIADGDPFSMILQCLVRSTPYRRGICAPQARHPCPLQARNFLARDPFSMIFQFFPSLPETRFP